MAGGDAPFDPLSVTGCVLWYDAAHVTTSFGPFVNGILDQSGNGRDASITGTPSLTASNSSYNNGPTVHRNDGSDQILSPDLGLTTGPFTFVFVGDAPTAAANFLVRAIGGGVGVDIRAQSSKYRASTDGGSTELEDTVADTTVPVVLVVVYNGVSSKLFASALTSVAGDSGSLPDLTGLGVYIGDAVGGGFGDLNFRHALVYDGALSDGDAGYLLNGFGGESAITISSGVFDPLSLTPTIYLVDYAGTSWTDSSGNARNFIAGTAVGATSADVGADFGSHPSADFDGSTNAMEGDGFTVGDILSASAFTMQFIAEFDTFTAPTGSVYLDATLIGDRADGDIYVTCTTAGVAAGYWSNGGGYITTTPVPVTTGVKYCIQVRLDSGVLTCAVRGVGSSSVSSPDLNAATVGRTPWLSDTYVDGGRVDARIAQFFAKGSALSSGDLDALYADAQTNFGVP